MARFSVSLTNILRSKQKGAPPVACEFDCAAQQCRAQCSARNPFGSGNPFGVRQTTVAAATRDLPNVPGIISESSTIQESIYHTATLLSLTLFSECFYGYPYKVDIHGFSVLLRMRKFGSPGFLFRA